MYTQAFTLIFNILFVLKNYNFDTFQTNLIIFFSQNAEYVFKKLRSIRLQCTPSMRITRTKKDGF